MKRWTLAAIAVVVLCASSGCTRGWVRWPGNNCTHPSFPRCCGSPTPWHGFNEGDGWYLGGNHRRGNQAERERERHWGRGLLADGKCYNEHLIGCQDKRRGGPGDSEHPGMRGPGMRGPGMGHPGMMGGPGMGHGPGGMAGGYGPGGMSPGGMGPGGMSPGGMGPGGMGPGGMGPGGMGPGGYGSGRMAGPTAFAPGGVPLSPEGFPMQPAPNALSGAHVAYPYYTNRGPRDFFYGYPPGSQPPGIGPR